MDKQIKQFVKNERGLLKVRRTMKLEFKNSISETILTGQEIKGEGGVPIEVVLVDAETGEVVEDQPEASANISFYLLNISESKELVVRPKEGKLPFLEESESLQLRKGVTMVNNLKVRNHAIEIKPRTFQLCAKVVGASRIKEARTATFTLKIYRYKYYQKYKNPSLSDEVSRLGKIQRGGEICKRLHDNKIYTVEDFLIQRLIDVRGLKKIVDPKQITMWEAIIVNALACQQTERVYWYRLRRMKRMTGIVFNILGRVLGAYWKGRYYRVKVEQMVPGAYYNAWEKVKSFEDMNSFHQHFADLKRKPNPPFLHDPVQRGTELAAGSLQTTATAPSSLPQDPPLTALAAQSFLQTTATAPASHLPDPPPQTGSVGEPDWDALSPIADIDWMMQT